MNPWLGSLRDLPFSHSQAITPNLDRLAAAGVTFTNAHAAAPLCNPARTAIMTGLHPSSSGVYGNYCWWKPHLGDTPTLPEVARANGYQAVGAGKVYHHCIGFNPPDQWDDYQVQTFDDTWDRQSRVNYPHLTPEPPPPGHPLHGMDYFVHEFDWGSLPIDEGKYGDQQAIDYAEDFLARAHAKPFYLACGLFHPHLPWYAPRRFFDLYDPEAIIIPAEYRETDWSLIPEKGKQLAALGPQDQDQFGVLSRAGKLRQAMHAYLANISFADAMIGRLLDALETSTHADNTFVIFHGDHGFHVGAKNHFGKQTLWRESTQVPLIIKGPGIPVEQRVNSVTTTLDLAATIGEFCHWSPPAHWESRSLAPLLRNEAPLRSAVLCSLNPATHAVITDEYRFISYDDGSEELYDLKNDAGEAHNLISQPGMKAIAQSLRDQLPTSPAPHAPGHEAYQFDWKNYRWSPV